MLELYHNEMSTCSQKVRLALAEKRADWISHAINLMAGENKTSEFLTLNPNGVVPVLVSNGTVVLESSIINEYIEEFRDGPRLMPTMPEGRAEVRAWVRQIDDKIHPCIGAITFGTALRKIHFGRPREQVVAEFKANSAPEYLPVRVSLFDEGEEAPAFKSAVAQIVAFLGKVEQNSRSKWLVGDEFTLADCALAPYIVRLAHLGASSVWEGGGLPRVEAWFNALKERPSYETAITKWQSDLTLTLLAQGGEKLVPLLMQSLK